MIEIMGAGLVKLDYGPTQMTVYVGGCSKPTEVAQYGALYAVGVLTELAKVKHIAAKPQTEITTDLEAFPVVLRRMVEAVRLSGDEELTPMAAVAGTIADMTAECLVCRGAAKVIVNNGGDIAVRLTGAEQTSVGIAPALGLAPTHVIRLDAGTEIGGITTSGLGGRSFTKGIATAAVVAAKSAAFADACATSLGNATYAEHPNIKRVLAERLDPNTDIRGHLVVREVGAVPPEIIRQALDNGRQRAAQLYETGLIKGAAIFIQYECLIVPDTFAQLLI